MTEALNQPRLVDSLSGAALIGPEELIGMVQWSLLGANAVESGVPFSVQTEKDALGQRRFAVQSHRVQSCAKCLKVEFFRAAPVDG